MELYVLRHGIAADVGPAGSGDAGRPLTEDGIVKMHEQARGMLHLGIKLDALFASPLVRTRQTAEIVGGALGIEPKLADALAPGCDLPRLRDLLGARRGAARILIVGHEPDCGRIVGALTGGSRMLFKKGSLARIDMAVLDQHAGVLVWLLTPRILRSMGQESRSE
jgi:phosphohistidine phosphatase